MTTPYTFRRRTIGRAASPPTWACYEQIHDDYDDDDDDDECSGSGSSGEDGDEGEFSDDSGSEAGHELLERPAGAADDDVAHDMEMDVDAEGTGTGTCDVATETKQDQHDADADAAEQGTAAAEKGKQRAVDPAPAPKRRTRKKQHRPRVYTLRPILTIQRSQGFVWNQDLFVPPYIKDRYIASTSPLNSTDFISTSVSSTNSALTDYEVDVVEIRVQEGEFDGIIP